MQLGKSIADLGGFALFIVAIMWAAVALHRGWIVPGWVYRQERDSRITAEVQAVRNGEALEKLARAVTGERAVPRRRPADPSGAVDGPR